MWSYRLMVFQLGFGARPVRVDLCWNGDWSGLSLLPVETVEMGNSQGQALLKALNDPILRKSSKIMLYLIDSDRFSRKSTDFR